MWWETDWGGSDGGIYFESSEGAKSNIRCFEIRGKKDSAPSGLRVLGGVIIHGAMPRAIDSALSGLMVCGIQFFYLFDILSGHTICYQRRGRKEKNTLCGLCALCV